MIPQGPSAAEVYAGAQFPWHQAMQPRWAVTVPNPTQFGYVVYRSTEEYYSYDAEVRTMDSPVAFTGSIVDLMLDALFARPTEYTFSVKADNFVPWGKRRDIRQQGAVPSPCDKLTVAAQKLRCQQQTNKTALLLRQGSLGSRPLSRTSWGPACCLISVMHGTEWADTHPAHQHQLHTNTNCHLHHFGWPSRHWLAIGQHGQGTLYTLVSER